MSRGNWWWTTSPRPAFMQPPARAAEREKDFKSVVSTPDDLDMLVTSKNHDIKSEVAEAVGHCRLGFSR